MCMAMDKRKKALQEFVKRARERYGNKIEKMILFGSYARGGAKKDSDIDILAVTPEKRFEMQKGLSGMAVDILLETGVYISVKVLTSGEYDFIKSIKTGFYQSIAREGVAVG